VLGLRNVLDCRSNFMVAQAFVRRPGEICLRYDSDTAAIGIDDRNSPHLAIGHHSLDALYVIILAAALRGRGHQVAHDSAAGLSFSESTHREIAIGYNTHDAARFDNGYAAAIVIAHHLRNFLH
jgi:hypothetical protein